MKIAPKDFTLCVLERAALVRAIDERLATLARTVTRKMASARAKTFKVSREIEALENEHARLSDLRVVLNAF